MARPATLSASALPARRGGGAYSRFVSAMKLFLPAIAVGLVMLVAAWPSIQESLERLRPKLPRLDLSEARDLRMVNARYSGIDKQHRPYVLTADVARQTPQQNDLMSLEGPKADLTLTNGTWLVLSARTSVSRSRGQGAGAGLDPSPPDARHRSPRRHRTAAGQQRFHRAWQCPGGERQRLGLPRHADRLLPRVPVSHQPLEARGRRSRGA